MILADLTPKVNKREGYLWTINHSYVSLYSITIEQGIKYGRVTHVMVCELTLASGRGSFLTLGHHPRALTSWDWSIIMDESFTRTNVEHKERRLPQYMLGTVHMKVSG